MDEIVAASKVLADHCQTQEGASGGKLTTGTLGRNWLALCAEGYL